VKVNFTGSRNSKGKLATTFSRLRKRNDKELRMRRDQHPSNGVIQLSAQRMATKGTYGTNQREIYLWYGLNWHQTAEASRYWDAGRLQLSEELLDGRTWLEGTAGTYLLKAPRVSDGMINMKNLNLEGQHLPTTVTCGLMTGIHVLRNSSIGNFFIMWTL
jgi:hypothetical protein